MKKKKNMEHQLSRALMMKALCVNFFILFENWMDGTRPEIVHTRLASKANQKFEMRFQMKNYDGTARFAKKLKFCRKKKKEKKSGIKAISTVERAGKFEEENTKNSLECLKSCWRDEELHKNNFFLVSDPEM